MARSAWLYGALLALAASPALPCSYEIPSLREAVNGATLIVVGTVESVAGEAVSPWYPEPVVLPQTATFAVEEVLKGTAPADRLNLLFPEDIVGSSCGPPYLAYLPGSRFVLLLDEPVALSTYQAPGIDPWRMRLAPTDDYTQTPLYLYLAGIVSDGVQPVRVAFEAPTAQRVGSPLMARATITNDLSVPLQLWLGRPQHGHVGLGLLLVVEGVSPSSYETPADEIGVIQVAPRSALTVDLGRVFTVAEPGPHGVRGYLWVPSGAPVLQYPPEGAAFYDILQGTRPNLWSYQAQVATQSRSGTWGSTKSAAHRQ